MDKHISESEVRKDKAKNILKYVFVLAAFALAFYFLRGLLTKKIDNDDLHIATVEYGDMQNTLSADGVVIPSLEREVNSPVATEIKRIVKRNGEFVEKGDLILELDPEFTQLSYDQLYDELNLKRNNIDKLKLEYDKNLRDLDYQDQIKARRSGRGGSPILRFTCRCPVSK